MAEINSGWALEAWAGVIHFAPIPQAEAENRVAAREDIYVVEAVCWPDYEEESPRLNQYFVVGLSGAIGMAAKLLGDLREPPEEIVAIRAASPAERETFEAVVDHF